MTILIQATQFQWSFVGDLFFDIKHKQFGFQQAEVQTAEDEKGMRLAFFVGYFVAMHSEEIQYCVDSLDLNLEVSFSQDNQFVSQFDFCKQNKLSFSLQSLLT